MLLQIKLRGRERNGAEETCSLTSFCYQGLQRRLIDYYGDVKLYKYSEYIILIEYHLLYVVDGINLSSTTTIVQRALLQHLRSLYLQRQRGKDRSLLLWILKEMDIKLDRSHFNLYHSCYLSNTVCRSFLFTNRNLSAVDW